MRNEELPFGTTARLISSFFIPYSSLNLFLRQIFPIAHGHVLLVLPGIEAFLDADCLKIGFPERLEKPFVFVHQTFVEHAGDKMPFAAVLTKSHLAHLLQVVIVSIGAFDVINQQRWSEKRSLKCSVTRGRAFFSGSTAAKKVPSAAFWKRTN